MQQRSDSSPSSTSDTSSSTNAVSNGAPRVTPGPEFNARPVADEATHPQQTLNTVASSQQQQQLESSISPPQQQQPWLESQKQQQQHSNYHSYSSSNVVEIDQVEVSPIDDPFYDPADRTTYNTNSSGSSQQLATLAPESGTNNSSGSGNSNNASGGSGISSQQQPKAPSTNAVAIDDVDFEGFALPLLDEAEAAAAGLQQQQQPPGTAAGSTTTSAASLSNQQQQPQQQQPSQQLQQQQQQQTSAAVARLLLGGRPAGGDTGMPDFPSGGLDLVQHLNLDGIFLLNKGSVTHDGKGPPIRVPREQQQDDADADAAAAADSTSSSSSKRHQRDRRGDKQQQQPAAAATTSSSRSSSRGRRQQQQQQDQQQQQPPPSQPRPHPFYVKPKHVKKHFKVTTVDGWKLHLIRTQVVNVPATQHHPVIMCPGLGSSGAYSFDLSPNVSLADYLAGKGWDVWTCELRGNGLSDKPQLFSSRSTKWNIDDYVEKDVPAIIRFVLKETKTQQVHFLGHSMGGMILCGVMARVDITTAKIRSCVCMGSGLFLEDSWWKLFNRFRFALNTLWVVPTGSLLRAYSRFMFGPYRIPYIDSLYFWDTNVDHRVGRAMMSRNFSNISVGVLKQMTTAFEPQGLLSHDRKMVYADPGRLAKVTAPALFLVGDRDRMCPPEGCRRTWQMLGSRDKRYICLGPASGFADHYGHFDILMGKRVETEVFPLIHQFLVQHDSVRARM